MSGLTEAEKGLLLERCHGAGEYPCMDDIRHQHGMFCQMRECDKKSGAKVGTVEPGMVAAVESIVAAREAALRETLAREIEAAFAAWDALGVVSSRAPYPMHTTGWLVNRAYDDAASIARGQR